MKRFIYTNVSIVSILMLFYLRIVVEGINNYHVILAIWGAVMARKIFDNDEIRLHKVSKWVLYILICINYGLCVMLYIAHFRGLDNLEDIINTFAFTTYIGLVGLYLWWMSEEKNQNSTNNA